MAYDTIDFGKICRTCLAETTDSKGLFNVHCLNEENVILSELLSACTSLEICETDGLPKQVCFQCIHYMVNSFSFQQQCHKSDATLRALLSGALQTQFIQLKPLDISTENTLSSLRINELLSSTSLQNETVETGLNDQVKTVDNVSNEVDNLDEESLNNEDVLFEKKISNLEGKKEAVEENLGSNENFKTKLGSTGKINTLNEPNRIISTGNKELGIFDKVVHGKELQTDYLSRNDLEQLRTEVQSVKDDETSQPIFPCEERGCFACFTTKHDLKRHFNTHLRAHYCKPCNQMFSSASTLSRHVNSKHQKGKKIHMCKDCGKTFGRSDDLIRHLRVHTGEKPFRCEKCGKAFAQSFRLLEHMRAHSNEKNFVCAICGKAFARYTSLLAHNKTHSDTKSHECKECGKKLCGSGSLSMHMKIHTGEKNYVCNYCGKGFTTPSNLITHQRIHTGEKPFVCNTCGKGFPDRSRLIVHNRIHSGEKPYICVYCNRGCISSSQLKKHVRIHTGEKPYECDMCEKRFPRSEDLKIHVKIHKGERNHVCDVCQKGFYQATTLRVHMRIHTGEKPYTCNICTKSFSQTGPFSIHVKTHSKEKLILPQDIGELNENEKIIQYL